MLCSNSYLFQFNKLDPYLKGWATMGSYQILEFWIESCVLFCYLVCFYSYHLIIIDKSQCKLECPQIHILRPFLFNLMVINEIVNHLWIGKRRIFSFDYIDVIEEYIYGPSEFCGMVFFLMMSLSFFCTVSFWYNIKFLIVIGCFFFSWMGNLCWESKLDLRSSKRGNEKYLMWKG